MKKDRIKIEKASTTKKRRNIFFKLAVLILVIYIAFLMLQQQATIKEKKDQLSELQYHLAVQKIANDQMNDILQASDEENQKYIVKKARERLDYSFSDEQVFVGITDN